MRLLLTFVVTIAAGSALWNWIHRLGGVGLILLGLADNSAIPLPGSMDVFTIILSAHKREWWPYYAAMATLGSVIGGYLTYRLARTGGHDTLEKKVGKNRVQKVYKKFEKHGGLSVFVGSILPPPVPIVPFLMAAGVLQYPRRKFLLALSGGRGVRYFAVAYVGHIYGQAIIGFFSQYYRPMLYVVIALAVAGGLGALLYFRWYRPKHKREQDRAPHPEPEPEHKAA